MFAVIFRAKIAELDGEYAETAERMRELAINRHGCMEFASCTEGNQEIAISYWETEEQIKAWKQNAEHLAAQARGKAGWYESYTVEVVRLVRSYRSGPGGQR